MNLIELKKGLIDLMTSLYPNHNFYAQDVVEKYERPAFFTQLRSVTMDPVNYNARRNVVAFYVYYMQEIADEVDALEVIESLRNLFGLAIKIGDRSVKVNDFDFDFVGTEREIPMITVTLEWNDRISHIESAPIMESAEIIYHMEES